MADRVWLAAWDLFRDVGCYNTDSHRIIEVSDSEIKDEFAAPGVDFFLTAPKCLFQYRLAELRHRTETGV
jgi:hypothetical protein